MTWAICIVVATAAFFLGYAYGKLREKLRWMGVFGTTRRDAGQFSAPVEVGAAWALAAAWQQATGELPPFLAADLASAKAINAGEIRLVK